MKRIILVLGLCIVLLSFTSAISESLGTFKQYSCVELQQTCANCSYVNITKIIKQGDSTNFLSDVSMTKTGTYYNYTFCNTSATGVYTVSGVGDEDGSAAIFVYDFTINPSGTENFSILDNSIFLMLFGFGLVILIMGIMLGNFWLGFVSSIMLLLSGIYTMIYGFNNLQNLYTQGVAVSLIGLGIIIMFSSAYEWWGEAREE